MRRLLVMFVLLVALPSNLPACSCALSFTDKVDRLSKTVGNVRKGVGLVFDDRCLKVAKTCPNQPRGEPITCKPYLDCRNLRAEIYAGCTAIQMALDMALVAHSLGQESEAKKIFAGAMDALEDLQQKVKKYNLAEVL